VAWQSQSKGWYGFNDAILFEHDDPLYDWQIDSSQKRLRMTENIGLSILFWQKNIFFVCPPERSEGSDL